MPTKDSRRNPMSESLPCGEEATRMDREKFVLEVLEVVGFAVCLFVLAFLCVTLLHF